MQFYNYITSYIASIFEKFMTSSYYRQYKQSDFRYQKRVFYLSNIAKILYMNSDGFLLIGNLYQLDGIYLISNDWFSYHGKCSFFYLLSVSCSITNYNLIITLCISNINCSDVITSNIIGLTWYCETWHWMSTLVLKWFELLQLMIWMHETWQLIYKSQFVIR